jgi:hypothetical protein
MKKYGPFIIVAIAVVTFICLLLVSAKNRPRQLNERITLRQKDKIPYGTYVARQLLPSLFPKARIFYDRNMPASWEAIDTTAINQAVILVAKEFDAEEWELDELKRFVERGNYAFIMAHNLSYDASNYFRSHSNNLALEEFLGGGEDSLQVSLESPPFTTRQAYQYPGKKFENVFPEIDTLRTAIMGRNESKEINFIQMQTGRGRIYIHLAPLAFSNYFLLHKDNIHYYEQTLSVIPPSVHKIVWNEYYLVKKNFNKEKQPSLYRVLFQYPSLKWGLLTALFTLLIFVLLELRRKQRMIPVVQAPKNESLDFVKTIGRLYYDQNDHVNRARKMSVYFLDHLRNQYKIATNTLDESFIATVHAKTGYAAEEIKQITGFIQFLETAPAITSEQLSHFYKQLENFYQNT